MRIKIVVFGLTISSSWGNGHATLWRGLCRALSRRGHQVVFFERDVPYYSGHRDFIAFPGAELRLYSEWEQVLPHAREALNNADVGIVTSYCPDALAATDLVLTSPTTHAFYDLDTPVTLARLDAGERVAYIGSGLLKDFDLVLSYTGGRALEELQTKLGARRVFPLYGSVDPEIHHPVGSVAEFASDLSYLGTYSEDRQAALQALFIEPANRLPHHRFMICGALYPQNFPWTNNSFYRQHVAPSQHPAFYCSSLITLNITRSPMAKMGYCPSGRLFEAAACGVPILSDEWEGLDEFFEPGSEVIIGRSPEDTISALGMPRAELDEIARAARERTLNMHTADSRVLDLESALNVVH